VELQLQLIRDPWLDWGEVAERRATIRCTATPSVIDRWMIVRLPANASAKLPSRGQVAVRGPMNDAEFWEWVRWVNATRNPDTRERRVEVTISKMEHGKRRPCCFDLSACTDADLSRNGRLLEPSPIG